MADADFTKNPYEVLGISPGGPEVTEAEIKKARLGDLLHQCVCVLIVVTEEILHPQPAS